VFIDLVREVGLNWVGSRIPPDRDRALASRSPSPRPTRTVSIPSIHILTPSVCPSFLSLPITPLPSPPMLDFDPFAPVYPSHVQDNDASFRFKAMQADPIPYSPYSPPPIPLAKFAYNSPSTPPTPPSASGPGSQSFTFDPFADEDSSTSSVASERERELVVQRLRRIEFLRRREWMRRVVAWVDGISQDTVSDVFPSFPDMRRWFLMSAKPKANTKQY
jgi:hypothetical protein